MARKTKEKEDNDTLGDTIKTPRTLRESLVEGTLVAYKELEAFELDNDKVLKKYRALVGEHARLEKLLKEQAATDSVPGMTITWHEATLCQVRVTGPVASPEYDLGQARAHWPKRVVDECVTLDKKLVRVALDRGDITVDLASKAVVTPEPLTPRVMVSYGPRRGK